MAVEREGEREMANMLARMPACVHLWVRPCESACIRGCVLMQALHASCSFRSSGLGMNSLFSPTSRGSPNAPGSLSLCVLGGGLRLRYDWLIDTARLPSTPGRIVRHSVPGSSVTLGAWLSMGLQPRVRYWLAEEMLRSSKPYSARVSSECACWFECCSAAAWSCWPW